MYVLMLLMGVINLEKDHSVQAFKLKQKHLFDDDDLYAYSNLLVEGQNINVLEEETKKIKQKEMRKEGMHAIEDTNSALEYAASLVDHEGANKEIGKEQESSDVTHLQLLEADSEESTK